MRETSSSRFDLGDGLRMCTAPDPFTSRSRVSPSRNLAASAMGLGTRRARLLPYLVSRVLFETPYIRCTSTRHARLYHEAAALHFHAGHRVVLHCVVVAHARAPNLGWIGFKRVDVDHPTGKMRLELAANGCARLLRGDRDVQSADWITH